jgi:CHAD domain-containing protein
VTFTLSRGSSAEPEVVAGIQRTFRNVARNAERTSKEVNVKNVHDLRTSIRRLTTSAGVLPQRARKKGSVKRFIRQSRKLFKATTPLRDFDIIQSVLSTFPRLPQSQDGSEINPDREQLASETLKETRRLLKLKVPTLKSRIATNRKSKKSLSSSIAKSVKKLKRDLPLVAGDPTKVELLHDTRMAAKELRYRLELLPETNARSEVLRLLADWQHSLGRVHDLDQTLEFLNDRGKNLYPQDVANAVAEERATAFEAFATSYHKAAPMPLITSRI